MHDWPTPVKAALTLAAVALPFVAGLGVVFWSKLRAARRPRARLSGGEAGPPRD